MRAVNDYWFEAVQRGVRITSDRRGRIWWTAPAGWRFRATRTHRVCMTDGAPLRPDMYEALYRQRAEWLLTAGLEQPQ